MVSIFLPEKSKKMHNLPPFGIHTFSRIMVSQKPYYT